MDTARMASFDASFSRHDVGRETSTCTNILEHILGGIHSLMVEALLEYARDPSLPRYQAKIYKARNEITLEQREGGKVKGRAVRIAEAKRYKVI